MDTPAASSNAPDHSDAADLPCPNCGYNLHGITSPRCPECGVEIDHSTLALPRIPWEHRRKTGSIRAYWRTLTAFTFSPLRWTDTAAVPLYTAAARFRAVTIMLAFLGILTPVLAVRILIKWREFGGDRTAFVYFFRSDEWESYLVELFRQPASLAISLTGVLLALIAITGLPLSFFRRPSLTIDQQRRAAALANYTCAPLAWLPLTLGFLASSVALNAWLREERIKWGFGLGLIVSAVVILSVQMFLWWLNTLRLLRASSDTGIRRIIVCAFFQPLASVLLLVLIPVGLQLVISYVTLVVLSLSRR